MSTGFAAKHADVIPPAKVTELCPDEMEAFVAAPARKFPERDIADVEAALILLATELACGPDDEVEGAFLTVEGMYEVWPAGRPFVGVVERRS